jgi:hypothetical protein
MYGKKGIIIVAVAVLTGCTFDTRGLNTSLTDGGEDGPAGQDTNAHNDQLFGDDRLTDRDLARADRCPDLISPDTLPPCLPGTTRCSGTCVDLKTDSNNCGACGKVCAAGTSCSNKLCCGAGLVNCSGTCVDLKTDSSNCGACGKVCAAGTSCLSSKCSSPATNGCADGGAEQVFQQGMVGCSGSVIWPGRAALCGAGFRVCSAAEWVARRGGVGPKYNYWTNNALRYSGSSSACWVSTSTGYNCSPTSSPMRVCTGHNDSLGNTCNWTNCGINGSTFNQYFGGCNTNYTAGTLCCPT